MCAAWRVTHAGVRSEFHTVPEKGVEASGAQTGLAFAVRRETSTILSKGKEDCVCSF